MYADCEICSVVQARFVHMGSSGPQLSNYKLYFEEPGREEGAELHERKNFELKGIEYEFPIWDFFLDCVIVLGIC